MSKIELTRDQWDAVYLRDTSLLVSAAAGSGKTRVLTERLMAYVTDKDEPKDIDSFLIITYTRAAAAELKGRILQELAQRCAEDPQNRRLRRQSTLCYKAQIGTIHSFCTALLRENSHLIGLAPDFRVGDEDKCAELKEKALELAMDACYEKMDEMEGFRELVSGVGAGRDDSRLAQTVLELHGKMQSHAYPEKWALDQIGRSSCEGFTDASQLIWGQELISNAKKTVEYWSARLDDIWFALNEDEEENSPIISAYGDSFAITMEQLRELSRALDIGWDASRERLPIDFPRLRPLKGYEFEDRKVMLTAARDGCKKAMQALETVFDAPSEKLLADMATTAPASDALLRLTLEFDKLYCREKRRLNLLDFSDLEHFAVRLLCDEQTGKATELARELSQRYTEIMIDEYQDVNAVQDLIFRCISKNEGNLFMVGDVKQSIYRFRLADPSIFLHKYRSFEPVRREGRSGAGKILLQKNFRSDAKVLYACNRVFGEIMSEELGEICYDERSALYPRDDAPQRGCVTLDVLAVPQAEDGEERPDKLCMEARMVAERIAGMLQSGQTILDGKRERPLECGDIAILLRSPNTSGAAFRRALSERGIPVAAEQGGGFFSSQEIIVMRALLEVIDNPHRDIPLTAVLMSPVFGFSADELSLIRAESRGTDFYNALCARAKHDELCAGFIKMLDELRSLSRDLKVTQLLSFIYRRLELPALCAARGGTGTGNLLLLSDLAAAYEENGYRGLYGFITQLERMEQRGDEPRGIAPELGNAVTIMSIHKSKGLEFPVVFLAGTSKRFNTTDLRSPVLIHPELGLGGKLVNIERGIEYPSLARRAIASRLTGEMLSEEMRVLYVAMTRAKERLHISCTAKDPQELCEKLSLGLTSPISPELLKGAQSMSQWLVSAALLDAGESIELSLRYPEQTQEVKDRKEAPQSENTAAEYGDIEALRAVLSRRYAHEASAALPAKITATMLPGDEPDDEAQSMEKRPRLFRLPDFAGEERPLTSSEKGVATHLVMQYIDFSRTSELSDVESEIARLCELGILSKRQAKVVDRAAVLGFFASEIGQRVLHADNVLREFRFSILCPGNALLDTDQTEELLLQGVVDCCIEENGILSVIDYKTDYVTQETLDAAVKEYEKQVKTYAYAMERITKKPVEASYLCFLRAGKAVRI